MFRIQVALTLFLAFAATAGAVYFQVDGALSTQAKAGLEGRLHAARAAVVRTQRLNDYRMAALAEQIADAPKVAAQLARRPESLADAEGNAPDMETFRYEIHKRMNEEVQVWRLQLEAVAAGTATPPAGAAGARIEAPDWFVVVDAAGVGVSSASDKAWYGPCDAGADKACDSDLAKAQPAIKAVIEQGTILADVWMVKGSPMIVGAAPVKAGETIVGAVVVGQRLTEAEARRQSALVGTQVAHFRGKTFTQSTSLSSDLEPQLSAAFDAAGILGGKATNGNVEVMLAGRRWLAAVDYLDGYPSAPDTGVAVLIDAQKVYDEAQAVLMWIPLAALAGFVICLLAFIAFFRRFVKPFEEVDRGVMELINGDPKAPEYWFDVPGSSLASTMSQNLNILVCNLSGRPLPEDLEEQARAKVGEATE